MVKKLPLEPFYATYEKKNEYVRAAAKEINDVENPGIVNKHVAQNLDVSRKVIRDSKINQGQGDLVLYSHLQHHNDTIIKQTQGQRHKKKGRMKEDTGRLL